MNYTKGQRLLAVGFVWLDVVGLEFDICALKCKMVVLKKKTCAETSESSLMFSVLREPITPNITLSRSLFWRHFSEEVRSSFLIMKNKL